MSSIEDLWEVRDLPARHVIAALTNAATDLVQLLSAGNRYHP